MRKTLFILAIVLCGSGLLFAQKPMKGFVSAGVSGGASGLADASVGMTFAGITTSAGHTITAGLPYSHLAKKEYSATAMGGTRYEDDYFVIDPVTVADGQAPLNPHRKYAMHPAPKGYDVVAVLDLTVIPCGPGVTADYPGGNSYESVPVAGHCWTKTNLKEEVNGYITYGDVDVYGYLYTWYGAVGLTTDGSASTDAPTPKTVGANVYVQGICPDGWHIPTAAEKSDLLAVDVTTLNHPTLWEGTHPAYTNTTGFTAVPAGIYNAALDRKEGLGTQTDWWTDNDAAAASAVIPVIEIGYYCDAPMEKTQSADNAMSVRCVKDVE